MGEPVKKKKIVLKEDMGYVDNLIVWIGKHPYMSAAGLILTFLGGAAAYGQLYKNKDSEKNAATAVIAADSLAPTPAPTVTPVNGSAVKEKPIRNDLYFILGTSDDDAVTPRMVSLGEYLNKSQGIPQYNVNILNSSEFTYQGFSEAIKSAGLKASDNAPL